MLGQLPETLVVNGVEYKIRSDFHTVMRIFGAYNCDELSDREKMYLCLKNIYVHLESVPINDYAEAYEAAAAFIEGREPKDKEDENERTPPKLVNWVKDEQLIFPAVNAVAGFEVRRAVNLHWWTFLGYFHSIDPESTWGFILLIRQKKAKHKKLEKHEQEFYNANREICEVDPPVLSNVKGAKLLEEIFNSLPDN